MTNIIDISLLKEGDIYPFAMRRSFMALLGVSFHVPSFTEELEYGNEL